MQDLAAKLGQRNVGKYHIVGINTMLPNLTVTATAAEFMRCVVRFSGVPLGAGFRLCVSVGACSEYDAEFSAEPEPHVGDEEMDIKGVRLFLPAESRLLLDGVTLDFIDSPTRTGLTFAKTAVRPSITASEGLGKL
ncbi:HesB/YadR/YfhF-family protein (modular protein) (plasmid) [Cupriavidus taiwanensis]|uniref:HesB/YadR/YfhF-family protein (Modular protein) n=2 Tax=Cupriavidus taiwanensis TaxID=164546 RepID=A0A375IVA5_9BURK|nr:HesB/YadR/YfhF-family protein (modular protein) [Cupriavidus taiwanensis]